MKDFENFWKWHQHMYPDSPTTKEYAQKIYNEYYACTCGSCVFRKEHGMMPVRSTHPICMCPITPLGEVYDRT